MYSRSAFACFFVVLFVAGAAPAQPISQHPENPAYFLWRGEAVALITSAEHYGAVLNSDFDYVKYLDALQRDGLNYTRIFTGSYVEPQGAFGIKHNTLAPGEGRFLAPFKRSTVPGYANGGNKFDLSELSPEYLDRLKSFVRAAGERGIVVEVALFCSTYSDKNWAIHPFNPANNIQNFEVSDWKLLHTTECPQVFPYQAGLVRGIVEALVDFDNVFYEIQNEPWADNHRMGEILVPFWTDKSQFPNAVEIPLERAVAWQAKIRQVIKETEAGMEAHHLVAQNVSNFCLAVHDDDLIADIGLINFHYALPEAVRWNRSYGKVIGFDESGFAGKEDATYLKQAWRFMMSGGGLFNNLDYSFSVGYEDGHDMENEAPGGGSPAFRNQLSVLSRYLHSFDLAKLSPNDALIVHSPGAACMVLSAGDTAHAVYLEGRGGAELTLRLEDGEWQAEWLSLESGATISDQRFEARGGEASVEIPTFQGGIALRLNAR